jgi:hypothetical protein
MTRWRPVMRIGKIVPVLKPAFAKMAGQMAFS